MENSISGSTIRDSLARIQNAKQDLADTVFRIFKIDNESAYVIVHFDFGSNRIVASVVDGAFRELKASSITDYKLKALAETQVAIRKFYEGEDLCLPVDEEAHEEFGLFLKSLGSENERYKNYGV